MREATIQKITNIKNVENSDFLDVVNILGWQVVTKRNQFNVGDLCVYIALDSLLPEKPEFEFLKGDKFRIRTKKLRGCLSQGIVFPLSILPEQTWAEDDDVSDVLNIIHYEKPVPVEMRGLIRGNFPPYIPKTDENRIQNYPDVINEMYGKKAYATVKCDGTSITISIKDGEFHICTRNNSLKIEDNENNVYIKTALKYNLQENLVNYGKNIALQGELCGEGIQKNRLCLKEHKIFMFNVWFIDEQRYGNYNELKQICTDLNLDIVPIAETIDSFDFTIEQLLEKAKGIYEGTKNLREGIVIRPVDEMYSRVMRGRMSFKALNNDYLVKFE